MGSQGARCVFLAVYYIFFLQKILLSSATLKLWLILSGVFFLYQESTRIIERTLLFAYMLNAP